MATSNDAWGLMLALYSEIISEGLGDQMWYQELNLDCLYQGKNLLALFPEWVPSDFRVVLFTSQGPGEDLLCGWFV